jgi:Na+/phosphate symporter
MDIFDFHTLLRALSIFLFGMNIMGQTLERRAGNYGAVVPYYIIMGQNIGTCMMAFLLAIASTRM